MNTQFQDKIPLFDLHCDTITELYKQKLSLSDAPLHISLEKAKGFSPYTQVLSVWTDKNDRDDEGYFHFLECINYFNKQIKASSTELPKFILGVEDARLLSNKIDRLQTLYDYGVRVLTLCWQGESCIGGGWNTSKSLTPFGVQVVQKCAYLGVVVDLSHSSLQVQQQVIELAHKHGFIPIFSHSNSYSVCNHKRNIFDKTFEDIVELGGLVGISLCCEHLANDGQASIRTVIKHIEHFLTLRGENTLCLGCDLDGVSCLPNGICSIADLSQLYFACISEFGKDITTKLFFSNAHNYFKTHQKEE